MTIMRALYLHNAKTDIFSKLREMMLLKRFLSHILEIRYSQMSPRPDV